MAKTAKKLKPKKTCCESRPRCKRCPIRLEKKAAKKARKKARKQAAKAHKAKDGD